MSKLKEGDKVRTIGSRRCNLDILDGVIIRRYEEKKECWIVQDKNCHCSTKDKLGKVPNSQYVDENDLELITDYQPLTPKVGDKFRVLKRLVRIVPDSSTLSIGSTVTIERIYNNTYKGWKVEENGKETYEDRCLTTEYLEPVESKHVLSKGKWIVTCQNKEEWVAINKSILNKDNCSFSCDSIRIIDGDFKSYGALEQYKNGSFTLLDMNNYNYIKASEVLGTKVVEEREPLDKKRGYKKGDRIRYIKDSAAWKSIKKGMTGVIEKDESVNSDGYACPWIIFDEVCNLGYDKKPDANSMFEIIGKEVEPINKTIINKTMNFIKKLTQSKADKTLEKAGFMDECGNLTTTGNAALTSLVFQDKKDELVKLAGEVIKENEA